MPTVSVPENASLEHLRGQARTLQRAVRAGDPDAVARVGAHDGASIEPAAAFPLARAQLVMAREQGFTSWARLKHYFDVVAEHRWDGSVPTGPAAAAEPIADRFGRLACLTYTEDDPERWAQARSLLAKHPELPASNIWAAAAAGDPAALRRHLSADPARAARRGGPYGWRPLFYLVYSRLDPAVGWPSVRAAAQLLLDAGADPNEGYLWNGLPTPFTLLTGVFGEGEQGPARQPAHPHAAALAALLLHAGADPNDGQTLYNRMFRPANDHLRLLFDHGLGTGDGGVWRARLGDAVDSPAAMLRDQLRWAIDHDFAERVELLAGHGVDLRSPFPADGRTPVEVAVRSGRRALVETLVAHGAPRPDLRPLDAFVGAALAADRTELDRLTAAHPGIGARARRRRPGLVVWAAADGRTDAVRLLVARGFDVNALGRGDTPVEGRWETALHQAAHHGNVELVRVLLGLGADPDLRDARFGGTPLDWARHSDQRSVAAVLAPITAPLPAGD